MQAVIAGLDSWQFCCWLLQQLLTWCHSPLTYIQHIRNVMYVLQLLHDDNETKCRIKWALFLALTLGIVLFKMYCAFALMWTLAGWVFGLIRACWRGCSESSAGTLSWTLTRC